MIRLETVLETWKTIRSDTAQAVEDFPADQMDFKPVPELMTFREIARHILDASQGITALLLAGEESLQTPDFREKVMQNASGLPADIDSATLAAALRSSADRSAAACAAKPADFFSQIITRMDGQKVTRGEMLQFVKEHELTHRAQLFLYLRLKGIVPSTTRRRMAKQASK